MRRSNGIDGNARSFGGWMNNPISTPLSNFPTNDRRSRRTPLSNTFFYLLICIFIEHWLIYAFFVRAFIKMNLYRLWNYLYKVLEGNMAKPLPFSYFHRLSTEVNNIGSQTSAKLCLVRQTPTARHCVLSDTTCQNKGNNVLLISRI
jgi:hypothetical protein